MTNPILNTSQDNALWVQCWRDRQTDFHQNLTNPLLIEFWPALHLALGSRILVPLCGKSLDMMWLLKQGHQVVGVELSPVAVRAFFKENHLQATQVQAGKLTRWVSGNLTIFCGDFFALTGQDLGIIDAIFDRAALTALPEILRPAYVAQLQLLTPLSSALMLMTTEDQDEDELAADALEISTEIDDLFGLNSHIELTHVETTADSNSATQSTYKVYRITSETSLNPQPQLTLSTM
ncbi:MAG: hypothetical protein RIR18_1027 [Pseudomonadota bacterium]|jgi:thiopurine S-methyltransferase